MSLLDLTLRNVRRNFRLYTIYLLSMITGGVIHFTFSSLMFNGDILSAVKNSVGFRNGLGLASAIIFLFIIFFILYANSFFMKQRKKELGMYLLYGMSERQVTRLLFYETLTIGAVSLVAGVLLGGLLSKLFGMLLMNLMGYDGVVTLSFPLEAIGTTACVYLILAVVIGLQNGLLVKRVQLVELFHARAVSDRPIRANTFLALAAIVLLAEAVILLAGGKNSPVWQGDSLLPALIAVAVGIIGGTYLFFRQFSGWLLQRIARSRKYHEGNTVLWASALRFQVRGNTLNLTFISLFSAAIILLTSFVAINYSVQFTSVNYNLPNSIAFQTPSDEALRDRIDAMIRDSGHEVQRHRTVEALRSEPVSGMAEAYGADDDFLPGMLLVAQRSYNEIVKLRGDDEEVALGGTEAAALSRGAEGEDFSQTGVRSEMTVALAGGENASFSVAERKDYALLGRATDPENAGKAKAPMLVIADDTYEALRERTAATETVTYEIYWIEDAGNAESLSAAVYGLVVAADSEAYYSSFADVYSKQIEGSSLLLFSFGFLALIALFALASVIYFRQLREATEFRRPYEILHKIGIYPHQLKNVIRKQLLFVFAPPLAFGLLFSWLILDVYLLDSLVEYPQLTGIVRGIMVAFFLIYLLLYASSANLYYKIVSRRP